MAAQEYPKGGSVKLEEKGAAGGVATLDSSGRVAEPVKKLQQSSGAPAGVADGDIWQDTSGTQIGYRAGGVNRLLERTSVRGQANGYCGLDASARVPVANMPSLGHNLAQAAPSFGSANAVTVPSTARKRTLYGSLNVTPAPALEARVDLYEETGVGTGTYTRILRARRAADAGSVPSTMPYSAPILAGRRYYYDRSGNGGITEAHDVYNYEDEG